MSPDAGSSLPLRECGLKFVRIVQKRNLAIVTPLAGVWIEIIIFTSPVLHISVTPLAGVWIEISPYPWGPGILTKSLPLRECGLKSTVHKAQGITIRVTPLAGVWIEIRHPLYKDKSTLRHSPCGSVD